MKFLLKRMVMALAVFILLPAVALAVNGNTFLGDGAGVNNTAGTDNTFIGENAGKANIGGRWNTFIGSNAGFTSGGEENIFIGWESGKSNIVGGANIFIGTAAGWSNTTGGSNVFIGESTGERNSTGRRNTFLGGVTGQLNTTGEENTYLGFFSGRLNTTGSRNLFLGNHAGYNETGSDKLYIENSDSSTPLIYGDFATDEVTINSTLKTTTLCLSGDCRTTWPSGGGSATVDKDEINNVGILGFEWNDLEVTDNLTISALGITGILTDSQIDDSLSIDATGSVALGALPVSTTGITNGNTTELATVDDIYDFVLANAGTPSLWTESGADIYRPTGKVGIGTSSPTATLDVDGNTKLRGEVRADGLLILTPMSESVRPACDSTTEGAISYSQDDEKFYGCNGKKWKKLN